MQQIYNTEILILCDKYKIGISLSTKYPFDEIIHIES